MKALTLLELSGATALKCTEVPIPVDDTGVLIAVRAVGIT